MLINSLLIFSFINFYSLLIKPEIFLNIRTKLGPNPIRKARPDLQTLNES